MHGRVGRVVTADWGKAYLHPPYGRCHEENMLWAIGDAADLSGAELAKHADRLLGGAGLQHRRVLLEGQAADQRCDQLVALGYQSARHIYMVHNGDVPPEPSVVVTEVPIDALIPAMDRYLQTDPDTLYGRDDVVRAHLLHHHQTYGSAGSDERCFAVLHDGDVAAWCKLWVRGAEAQVEDVVCLYEHRGKGYGRAVVAAATRAGLAGNPQQLFIAADADDWPKKLYERLGYREVGSIGVFIRVVPETPR